MPVSTIPSSGLTSPITSATITTANVTTLNAPSGVLATQNGMAGIAKAWVSFNGSTGAITSSFNVSSITVLATGQYTITFTTAMPNINYAINANASVQVDNRVGAVIGINSGVWTDIAPTTSAFSIVTTNDVSALYNPTYVCITVHSL
jgi:hypothetical protein